MNTQFSFVRTAFTAALLAFAVSAPAARAQYSRTLARATVPFAFQYGTHTFAAGNYSLNMISGNILQIQGRNSAAFALVDRTDDRHQSKTDKLVFYRDADRYVLRDIWLPELRAHLHCPQPRQRKQRDVAEAKPASSTEVEVAALEGVR